MKYFSVKNPKWANSAHTAIDCMVNFEHIGEYSPFTSVYSGDFSHTHEIFSRCIDGDFGPIEEYMPPIDIVGDDALNYVRAKRDHIISIEIDPVVSNPLRWSDLSLSQQQAWAAYRRELLNITVTCPNPSYVWDETSQQYNEIGVVWPVKP